MKELDKKKKIYLGVLVTSLIALVAGVSFAYISYTAKQTSTNTIGTSCVKVTLSDVTKPISLDKAYPLKDSEAEQLTPYTFKIENNCDTPVTYKVDLDVLNTTKPTPLTDLAIQVDNNTKRILNSLDNSDNLIENAYAAKEIFGSGVLNVGSSIEHSIKIWLDETATNDSQNTTHNSKVVVTATQDTSLEVKDVMSSFMNETVYLTYKTFGSEANVSCKYGLTEDNLNQNGTNITKTSCELNPTNPNTTYYYEVCLTTSSGVNKCIKDRVDTRIEEITTEPILNTDNIEIPITTTGNNITCKYSTEENVYTTEGIIEENKCKITPIEQGKTYYYQICSTNELGNTGCITGQQATEVPTLTLLALKDVTTNSLTIPYTTTGTEVTTTCKYGTNANDLVNTGTISNNQCNINVEDGTTYYEVTATNKYGGSVTEKGNVTKETGINIYNNANLGDYVAYTPSKTSYEIANSLTGMNMFSGTMESLKAIKSAGKQTINPSELNIWRIISKASNKIDIVSEYTSSVNVCFCGSEGYRRFVGTLNTIASQYENSTYTSGSHHVGYDGEMLTCSNYTSCSDQKKYSENSNLETSDTQKIKEVIGTRAASRPDGVMRKYWLASRMLYDGFGPDDLSYSGRNVVSYNGGIFSDTTIAPSTDIWGDAYCNDVRPIVALKQGLLGAKLSQGDKIWWVVN